VHRVRTLAVATLALGTGVTLAACGGGNASSVVRTTQPPAAGSTGSPAGSGSTAASPAGPGSSASSGFDARTLDQIDADLGALDNELQQATNDLNNAQGDS